ncbi:MAG: helix-turn-helix domain-containing protein [Rhodobacteraceae bacterium]|nr:helix-turn-helix domain-containing protein [Paracoccaceae bacterium]
MPNTDTSDVRALPLFQSMDEANFDSLLRNAYIQNFPPMVDLIIEGDPSDFLHVVLTGSVELFANCNERETTMATLRPISTFILAASIRGAPYLMSARTMEKSRILMLPNVDVQAIFDIDHMFARAVVTELAQCYRSVVKGTKDLKLRTSVERLANYLLRQQSLAGGGPKFTLRTEKRRLAAFLNMTPENMSRAIKTLKPYGVSVARNIVTIHDQEELKKFAKPTVLIDDYSS